MTPTRASEGRQRLWSAPPRSSWLLLPLAASVILVHVSPTHAAAQATGRSVVESLEFEPLDFQQPVVEERSVLGVDVLLLEDDDLPLVTLHAYFRGGYARFSRSSYAAAMGLPALLRYGGTVERTPQEVDELMAHLALQTSFGTGGGSITSSMNTLTEHLDTATELWGEMLVEPGFDTGEVEAWRARQVESVRRRADDPGRLAVAEMNRLLYGDHPVGWEMTAVDLLPERVTPEAFRRVHRGIVCRENLVLGFTGDVDWTRAQPLAEGLAGRIPPCAVELAEEPLPEIRRAPGVFVVEKSLEQAVVVMAHPTDVRLADDNQYFAALIGNSILGGGGFSSRILQRVRTDEGYAYSATSLWTTPRRHEGLIGAMTRTRPENVAPAIDVILATMRGLLDGPPRADEVDTTVDQIINGFVFNFESASQVVSRTMYYRAIDLPDDWLERYWEGVQKVDPDDVSSVFREHLRPDEMTILIVGDSERMGLEALGRFGPVEILVPEPR